MTDNQKPGQSEAVANAVIARVQTWLDQRGGFNAYADRVRSGCTGWSQLRSNIWLAVHSLTAEAAHPSPAPASDAWPDDLEAGNRDCLAKRKPGEPMFIILGRDPDGGYIVRQWGQRRASAGDPAHGALALRIADAMDAWEGMPDSAPDRASYLSPASDDEPCENGEHCCCCGPGEPCCDCGQIMPAPPATDRADITKGIKQCSTGASDAGEPSSVAGVKKVVTSREIMIAGGVDPDGPFEVGHFPKEMRQAAPSASDEAIVEAVRREAEGLREHCKKYPSGYLTKHDLGGLFTALDNWTAAAPMIRAQAMSDVAAWLRDQRDEPWPQGSDIERVNYWRDKCLRFADQIDRGEVPATPAAGGVNGHT